MSAIVALRILGQETTLIPKDRLVAALGRMLDRPQLADLVIPDLARWQDWKAMDRLVDLFKNANEESSWVRVPVVQFLRACPDPKAQEYLKELAKIDPDAVKRATNFLALPGASGPAATAASAGPPAATTPSAPDGLANTLEAEAKEGAQDESVIGSGSAAANFADGVPNTDPALGIASPPRPESAPVTATTDDDQDPQSQAASATADRTGGPTVTTVWSSSFEIPLVWLAVIVCLAIAAGSVLVLSRRRAAP